MVYILSLEATFLLLKDPLIVAFFFDCIVQKIDNCLLFGSFSAVIINEPLCDLFSNYFNFNDHVTPPDVRN